MIENKKILSIDGGGIKGVFPAAFLANIEDRIGGKVAEYFDLIIGTSTGGILALSLGLGYSAAEILEFYKNYGQKIFSGNFLINYVKHFFSAKYNQYELRSALNNTLGTALLGDSKNRLVIPSLDLSTGKVYIYKTAHHERFNTDYKQLAIDVALSTAAAPTYFPAHTLPSGSPLVDGGLWANNPIGFAVVEAIGILKWKPESLKILSIGCTSTPVATGRYNQLARGKKYWAFKAIDLIMSAQSSASWGIAAVLTSHSQIIRINPVISSGKFSLDNYKAIPQLEGLGSSCAREEYPQINHFFQSRAQPFTPIYNN